MSNLDLSRKIAREVFDYVEFPGDSVQRLAYKGGQYPDAETDLGGLCEEALAGVIQSALDKHLPREDATP